MSFINPSKVKTTRVQYYYIFPQPRVQGQSPAKWGWVALATRHSLYLKSGGEEAEHDLKQTLIPS